MQGGETSRGFFGIPIQQKGVAWFDFFLAAPEFWSNTQKGNFFLKGKRKKLGCTFVAITLGYRFVVSRMYFANFLDRESSMHGRRTTLGKFENINLARQWWTSQWVWLAFPSSWRKIGKVRSKRGAHSFPRHLLNPDCGLEFKKLFWFWSLLKQSNFLQTTFSFYFCSCTWFKCKLWTNRKLKWSWKHGWVSFEV